MWIPLLVRTNNLLWKVGSVVSTSLLFISTTFKLMIRSESFAEFGSTIPPLTSLISNCLGLMLQLRSDYKANL